MALLGAMSRAIIASYRKNQLDEITFTQFVISHLFTVLGISPKEYGYGWIDVKDEMQLLILFLLKENKQRKAHRILKEYHILCRKWNLKVDLQTLDGINLKNLSKVIELNKYNRFLRRSEYYCSKSSDQLFL